MRRTLLSLLPCALRGRRLRLGTSCLCHPRPTTYAEGLYASSPPAPGKNLVPGQHDGSGDHYIASGTGVQRHAGSALHTGLKPPTTVQSCSTRNSLYRETPGLQLARHGEVRSRISDDRISRLGGDLSPAERNRNDRKRDRQWEAMEFCWRQLGHCAVLDPVVAFLQSKVDNRLRLAAEGWGPKVSLGRPGRGRSNSGRQMRTIKPSQLDLGNHHMGRLHREIQRHLRANTGDQTPGRATVRHQLRCSLQSRALLAQR